LSSNSLADTIAVVPSQPDHRDFTRSQVSVVTVVSTHYLIPSQHALATKQTALQIVLPCQPLAIRAGGYRPRAASTERTQGKPANGSTDWAA
jgi:hypothetical protein